MARPVPRPAWLYQPPPGVRAKALPGLNMLLLAVGGNQFIDCAGGKQVPISSSLVARNNSRGRAVGSISGTTLQVPGLNTTGKFSRVAVVAKKDAGSAMGISDTRDDTSGGAGWYIDSSERLTLDKSFVVNIVQSAALAELNNQDGSGSNVVGVTYDGTTAKLFCNGRLVATGTSSQTFSFTSGTLFRGSNLTSGGFAANEINLHADFTFALSEAQMCAYTANPWQMFAEPHLYLPFVSAASGAYTLTAAAGTFTETGQDAGLLAARTITGEAGSFTETGQDAGLYVGRVATGDAGAFTFTGNDATLTYTPAGAYTLSADAGTFTETGQDAGLLAARTIAGAAGSFTETGLDAGLYAGRVVTGDAGSFTETGQDADLIVARRIAGDAAAFVETGQDASLIYSASGGYTLTAARGTFTFTGIDAIPSPFVALPNRRRIGRARMNAAAAAIGSTVAHPINARIGD